MMNQGVEPAAGINTNPSEVSYMGHPQPPPNPYSAASGPPQHWPPPPSQPPPPPWNYRPENPNSQNGYPSNYYYSSHAQTGPPSAAANPYNNTGYNQSSTDYTTGFYGNSTSHQVAPNQNQNTGASYQPPFQNSVPHTSSTTTSSTMSNSNTYYNASGDHQNSAASAASPYQSTNYSYQQQQASQNYGYPSSNHGNNTAAVVNPSYQHQHQYSQHQPYYYYQTAGAPSVGTEGAAGGYSSYPSNQPPPPGTTTSWRPDIGNPNLPPVQGIGAGGYQTQYPGQYQSYPPQPTDQAPVPNSVPATNNGNQGNVYYSQPHNMHVSTNQFQQAFQMPPPQLPPPPQLQPPQLQPLPQLQPPPPPPPPPPPSYPVQIPDSRQAQESPHLQPNMAQMQDTRQVSKMQIPTNPRIASGLSRDASKVDKGSSITSGAQAKPAYVSVPVPKNDTNQASTAGDAEKGVFPVSLKAYVERSFARCKTDAQRVANQTRLKEVITKATVDGTMYTTNWDLEPLFPLPSGDTINTKNALDSNIFSSLTKEKRKSRWEPIEETPPAKKIEPVSNNITNSAPSYARYKRPEPTSKIDGRSWSAMKFIKAQKQSNFSNSNTVPLNKKQKTNTFIRKPFEKSAAESSSDSDDKEKELTKYYSGAISIANSPEEKMRREHRSKRFDKRKSDNNNSSTPNNNSSSILARKANAMLLAKSYDDTNGNDKAVEDIDWDSLTVKGTSQEIEKRYLRLTSAPDPSTVRPEDVLEKALEMVWTSNKNYLYKCDQLKSIRQDLTVQRIENELTVKVYETHARLAIQFGDVAEYNQCQSQLKRLYAEGIKGCDNEFSAYHLLHVSIHSNNKRDLLSSMARLSINAKQDEAVKHALKVRSAVSSSNYLLFFRLYKVAPNLNNFLMDLYVEKMRFEAVKSMSKAYRPTLPVRYVAHVLGFMKNYDGKESETTVENAVEECEQWLKAHGAVLKSDNNGDLQLDGKASMTTLYMPEPENAVSHGDASLAVDDFLTRAP